MSLTVGLFASGLDVAAKLEALLNAAENPSVSALTVVSGTAQQDTTGLPSDVYVTVTGGTSGTVVVKIGPTSSVADTIETVAAAVNVTPRFRLPAGWFFEVTVGGSAAIASTAQVVGG